jgi:hypothetical protein
VVRECWLNADCGHGAGKVDHNGIDINASQFPQSPVPRRSPEQVGGYTATNASLERYPLKQHGDLQDYAQDRLSGGQKSCSTVLRDPRHKP